MRMNLSLHQSDYCPPVMQKIITDFEMRSEILLRRGNFQKGFFCCNFKQYIRKSELLTWGMMQCDSQLPDEKRTESHLLLLLLLLQSFQILARLPSSLLFCREFLNFNSSLQTCTQDELEERKNIRAQSKSAALSAPKSAALSAPMSATLSAILASHVLQEAPFHTYSN